MSDLTHIDEHGKSKMVDISSKKATLRKAVACVRVKMNNHTLSLIRKNEIAKGDVLATARIAGIMAAKRTHELIPLCHPLSIGSISIDFNFDEKNSSIVVLSSVAGVEKTGFEMEALVAATTAGLTIYDMCKSVEKGIVLTDIHLVSKTGGKSGTYIFREITSEQTQP